MKTVLKISLVAAMLFMLLGAASMEAAARSEAMKAPETPHFVFGQYTPGNGVRGIVEIPEGFARCYVAAMFWIDGWNHADALMTIGENGEFSCEEKTEAAYVVLWIVDNDFIFTNGPFRVYDLWRMNYRMRQPPRLTNRRTD